MPEVLRGHAPGDRRRRAMSSPCVQRRSHNRVVSRRNDDEKRRALAAARCSGNAGACRPRHHAPRLSNAPPVGGPARAARRGTQGRPLTQGGTRRARDVVRRRLVAGCGAVADPAIGGTPPRGSGTRVVGRLRDDERVRRWTPGSDRSSRCQRLWRTPLGAHPERGAKGRTCVPSPTALASHSTWRWCRCRCGPWGTWPSPASAR